MALLSTCELVTKFRPRNKVNKERQRKTIFRYSTVLIYCLLSSIFAAHAWLLLCVIFVTHCYFTKEKKKKLRPGPKNKTCNIAQLSSNTEELVDYGECKDPLFSNTNISKTDTVAHRLVRFFENNCLSASEK